MIPVLLTIIVIAVILIVLTFFMNDKFNELENQIEQNSISALQDTYQIKKKLKILEEELLTESKPEPIPSIHGHINNKPILIQKVYHLHQQGYSIDAISKQTDLSEHDIQTILKNSN